jgi:hypothetical protein
MDNKAREINSPLIKQLIDETSPEELAKIDADMNNKQQTAVEIFWNQLPEILPFTVDTATAVKLDEAYQKAKEMEKERTINFTEDWYFNGPLLGEGIDVKNTIEQHFNETYGGGEQ